MKHIDENIGLSHILDDLDSGNALVQQHSESARPLAGDLDDLDGLDDLDDLDGLDDLMDDLDDLGDLDDLDDLDLDDLDLDELDGEMGDSSQAPSAQCRMLLIGETCKEGNWEEIYRANKHDIMRDEGRDYWFQHYSDCSPEHLAKICLGQSKTTCEAHLTASLAFQAKIMEMTVEKMKASTCKFWSRSHEFTNSDIADMKKIGVTCTAAKVRSFCGWR
jgi:hypothetical protein